MRIGAKYGERSRAISGDSSITSLAQIKFFVEEPLKSYSQKDHTDEAIFDIMMRHRQHLPPLKFDCGTSDLLIKCNRDLQKNGERRHKPRV